MADRVEHLSESVVLYLGDCREILPAIDGVDAVVTDPPYGIGVEYGSFIDTPENVAGLAATFVPLARRCAERVVITTGTKAMYLYETPTWTMAWVNPAGAGCNPWGFTCWHPILVYGKDPYLATGKGSRQDIIVHNEASETNGHPCPKPVGFMTKLIARVSLSGTICDPFMGSGTTGVAAVKLGRGFIGIEIEQRYFDISCRRIAAALKQPDLFIERLARAQPLELPFNAAGRP